MDYFNILNLAREPFSNSPDPDFFFHSRQHKDCLQKLELSLLLRRGLSVVIGDVGTGKTTLCRQLIRRFAPRADVETHLILDPYFLNASEFLGTVTKMFCGRKPAPASVDWQVKEHIKQHLFRKGVEDNRTVVLIIDEGQKIPAFCLEILREFLNYETNEFKLLQIIIFAQKEFDATIRRYPNFADRINLYHQLKPLNFHDTRHMIKYRLEISSNSPQTLNLFSYPALWAIYRITGGYPRKIINLCHQSVLSMIIQNRSKCSYLLVRTCARRVFADEQRSWKKRAAFGGLAVIAAAVLILAAVPAQRMGLLPAWMTRKIQSALARQPEKAERFKAPIIDVQPPPIQEAQVRRQDQSDSSPPEADGQAISDSPRTQPAAPPSGPPAPDGRIETETQNTAPAPVAAAFLETVRDNSLKTPAQPTPMAAQYAEILGRMTLKRNESLSRIIHKIYGEFNSRYFKNFLRVNPDIKDPDHVEVGQPIWLPAIPARVKAPDRPVWWVQIDETDALENAFDILRRHPDASPPLGLVPYWNPNDGLKFALVLKQLYASRTAAADQLELLPEELAGDAMPASLWDPKTVYFADPFFGQQPR